MEIMSLGDNLRLMRKKKGWTQQELATKTGIKLAHISTLENKDSDPKLSTIYKLMEALGCTANELLLSEVMQGGDSGFKSYLEKAQRLPAKDRTTIIEIIKKFVSADYVRLASLADAPDDIVESIVIDMHTNDENSYDAEEVRNDLEKVKELRGERG